MFSFALALDRLNFFDRSEGVAKLTMELDLLRESVLGVANIDMDCLRRLLSSGEGEV